MENASRFRSKEGFQETSTNGRNGKNHRHGDENVGEIVKCSGEYCRSCAAAAVADCVAVCCCPCAVLSFFALAFFKAPWMVGRRCLGLGKKKAKKLEKKRQYETEMDGSSRKESVEVATSEIVSGGFQDEERVWLELYQLGHLGFGRVSFTGIQSQGKGN
ncbi:uncharacterized protein LOC127798660 [Diospyros lotus]|uniref:uncharacterized protein LOC127798660 n=1 Tax=Diospyros lotus TaxID=55363 RepID=UPI00225343E9|nr:uncharacterized protein LOC127798660 [Diospyros lotus]